MADEFSFVRPQYLQGTTSPQVEWDGPAGMQVTELDKAYLMPPDVEAAGLGVHAERRLTPLSGPPLQLHQVIYRLNQAELHLGERGVGHI